MVLDDEWYTPRAYIDAAATTMGAIDMDPASSVSANSVVGAGVYYAIEDDGLKRPWRGRIWMNPPYSGCQLGTFCAKLVSEYRVGRVSEACAFITSDTHTDWFQDLMVEATAAFFPRGRVAFWHPRGESSNPTEGTAVVYLGPNSKRFRDAYAALAGFVVYAG